MCLYYSPQSTGNVRRQFNKQAHLPKHLRKITCLKYLSITEEKTVQSPSFFNIKTKWKIGWVKSSRYGLSIMQDDLDKHTTTYGKTISRGIHVYLTSSINAAYKYIPFINIANKIGYLKVLCYEKDFVGAGDGEAVFTKVFVTKKHWNEFCREYKINGVK